MLVNRRLFTRSQRYNLYQQRADIYTSYGRNFTFHSRSQPMKMLASSAVANHFCRGVAKQSMNEWAMYYIVCSDYLLLNALQAWAPN